MTTRKWGFRFLVAMGITVAVGGSAFAQANDALRWRWVKFQELTGDPAVPASNAITLYSKDNGGTSWLYARDDAGTIHDLFAGGGGAPTGATYLTQTPDGTLSAEQAMSLLTTGIVINTTGTGVQSIYGGTSCTNQFVRSLDASGAATCNTVALADTSGIAPSNAQYWTAAADGTLSAEVNLGALGTGLILNTAGTPSQYAGTSCTNQFPRSLNTNGAATCASVVSADLNITTTSCGVGAAINALTASAGGTCDGNVMFDDEANTVTQNMTFSDGAGDSPVVAFTPQTGTTWGIYGDDAADDLVIFANTGATEQVQILNAGAGIANLAVEGTSASTNYPAGGADDQVLVASSATASAWKTLPDCNTNNMLTYTQATNSFGCDADDGGGGGGLTHPQVMTRLAVGGAY